jgi:hypothetical protein
MVCYCLCFIVLIHTHFFFGALTVLKKNFFVQKCDQYLHTANVMVSSNLVFTGQ